ncbi:hypothetical protein ACLB1T_32245 [Escherichia coli]
MLAESVGMLPCSLYKITGTLKTRAVDERLHKLISAKPNGYISTGISGAAFLFVCLCLRGNFYAYKVKALGEVVELLPI